MYLNIVEWKIMLRSVDIICSAILITGLIHALTMSMDRKKRIPNLKWVIFKKKFLNSVFKSDLGT